MEEIFPNAEGMGMNLVKEINIVAENMLINLDEAIDDKGTKTLGSVRCHCELKSVCLDGETIIHHDCVVLTTDHDVLDYSCLKQASVSVEHTRGWLLRAKNIITA